MTAVSKYTDICKTHGEFESEIMEIIPGANPLRKGCPACLAQRQKEREEDEAEKARIKANEQRIARENKMIRAGITMRFKDKGFDDFQATTPEQEKAKAAMMGLVDAIKNKGEAKNLILTGKPGTGKSHLCCAVINSLFATHHVRRIDLPALVREIRATWAKGSEDTEDDVIHEYGRLDLLILEEAGTGTGSEDEKSRIFSVLNMRYEWCLPTVIVTNLGLDALKSELGDRVIDRLREGGALVPFDWESARGRK